MKALSYRRLEYCICVADRFNSFMFYSQNVVQVVEIHSKFKLKTLSKPISNHSLQM